MFQLTTLRSNDQFSTAIDGYHDRFRGVKGTRHVLFMSRADITSRGLCDGDIVRLQTAVDDVVLREVTGLRIVECDIPGRVLRRLLSRVQSVGAAVAGDPKWHVPGSNAVTVRVLPELAAE